MTERESGPKNHTPIFASAYGLKVVFHEDTVEILDQADFSQIVEVPMSAGLANEGIKAARSPGRKQFHPDDRIVGAVLEILMDTPELEAYL